LSALAVFFRDIIHLYGILTQALFYLTPIFYPVDILAPEILPYIKLNPLFWYVSLFRDLVYYGKMPTAEAWIMTAGFAVAFLAIGLFVFKKNQDKFILYM
jgi:ABC-2 type transport system permease protein